MNYQIKFIAGENVGNCRKLTQEQSLSIGRSHTNDVCLNAPDVSGRHLIIRVGTGTVTVEVLSSRITVHNDKTMKLGDIFEIFAGDKIQMGSSSVFELERLSDTMEVTAGSDDDATVFPEAANNGDELKTVPEAVDGNSKDVSTPASAPVPVQADEQSTVFNEPVMEESAGSGTETVAFQTRMASDDELNEIKKAYRNKHYRKILTIALPIIVFFAAAIALYITLKPVTEEFLTWPKDKSGNDLDDFKQIAPYLAVCYPKAANVSVRTEGSSLNIATRIGKMQDVPMYISASSQADLKSLKIDHQEAFDAWCEQMRDQDPTVNFSGDKTTVFLNTDYGAGVPVSFLSFTRRKNNDDFWGYAAFIRNAQNVHCVLFEVPFAAKWRAERFMRAYIRSMIVYAVRRTGEHWEGAASYRSATAVDQDLEEACSFMNREAPVYWGRIFYLLRSALIKAAINKNAAQIEQAQKMLRELREQQTVWYGTQKLAYQYAERNEDKHMMRSIQAMSESVFSAEFQFADFRYDLIKRKDWK